MKSGTKGLHRHKYNRFQYGEKYAVKKVTDNTKSGSPNKINPVKGIPKSKNYP